MINSYVKGRKGMNDFRHLLNKKFGCSYHRTAQTERQHCKADLQKKWGTKITIIDSIHWEIKNLKKCSVYKHLEQAQSDNPDPMKVPVVGLKANDEDWIAILKADDFFNYLLKIEEQKEEIQQLKEELQVEEDLGKVAK